MGKIVICAIARDEDNIILEWTAYYLLIGADIVHIVDDNSKIPISEVLQPLMKQFPGRIVVSRVDFEFVTEPDKLKASEYYSEELITKCKYMPQHKQIYFYNWMFLKYLKEKWIGFIDIDEFLWLAHFTSIHDMLDHYNDYDQVSLNWILYGHNYNITYPDGLLIDNFTTHASSFHILCKYFTKPATVLNIVEVHHSVLVPHGKVAWPMKDANCIIDKKYTQSEIAAIPHVKHYCLQDITTMLQRRFLRDTVMSAEMDITVRSRKIYSQFVNDSTYSVYSTDISDRYSDILCKISGKTKLQQIVDQSGRIDKICPIHYAKINNLESPLNLQDSLMHYIITYPQNKLEFTNILPHDFNWKVYGELHKDLIDVKLTTEKALSEHYVNYGIREGRQYKL